MLPSSTFAIMARRKEADHRDMLEYADTSIKGTPLK